MPVYNIITRRCKVMHQCDCYYYYVQIILIKQCISVLRVTRCYVVMTYINTYTFTHVRVPVV